MYAMLELLPCTVASSTANISPSRLYCYSLDQVDIGDYLYIHAILHLCHITAYWAAMIAAFSIPFQEDCLPLSQLKTVGADNIILAAGPQY